MKKVSLDTWIHLLGMVGLLGGLVFVGLEMRQSQKIALADTEQQRAIAQQQNFWAFLESGHDLAKYLEHRMLTNYRAEKLLRGGPITIFNGTSQKVISRSIEMA